MLKLEQQTSCWHLKAELFLTTAQNLRKESIMSKGFTDLFTHCANFTDLRKIVRCNVLTSAVITTGPTSTFTSSTAHMYHNNGPKPIFLKPFTNAGCVPSSTLGNQGYSSYPRFREESVKEKPWGSLYKIRDACCLTVLCTCIELFKLNLYK